MKYYIFLIIFITELVYAKNIFEFNYRPIEIEYKSDLNKRVPPPRDKKSFNLIRKKAEADADNAYLLGSIYLYNDCLDDENQIIKRSSCYEALKWFNQAYQLNQNHRLAIYHIGIIYDFFLEEKDKKTAISYYKKAADLGEVSAYNILFTAYFHGIEVERNLEIAKQYAKKSAELGNEQFKYILRNWDNEFVPYFNKIYNGK